MWKLSLSSMLVVAGFLLFAPAPVAAQQLAIVTYNNNCLVPDTNRNIIVKPCTEGGVRYTLYNGQVRTQDNYCFDYSVPRGADYRDSRTNGVKLAPCIDTQFPIQGGPAFQTSQNWYFMVDGAGKYLAQSAHDGRLCLNIEGGADQDGGRVIVWGCGYNNPGANERFYPGPGVSLASIARNLDQQSLNVLSRPNGVVIYQNYVKLVAAGGGNIVAAGGGNLVAAGGGNFGATIRSGALIGLDGATLIGHDGSSLKQLIAGSPIIWWR